MRGDERTGRDVQLYGVGAAGSAGPSAAGDSAADGCGFALVER